MADNEKWFLEQFADFFDREHLANMRFMNQYFTDSNEVSAEIYGKDSLLARNVKFNNQILYGILDFSGSVAGSFFDILRFGEVVRKPSIGAVIRDGLRLLSAVGVGKVIVQARSLSLAARVPFGDNSCGPTAMTRALILSGTRMGAHQRRNG